MSVPKFSVDILDAILSPNNSSDKGCRKDAESQYNSFSVLERTQSLLQILTDLQSKNCEFGATSSHINDINVGRMNLAAVLLRKEISRLASDDMATSISDVDIQNMVNPLLNLYLQKNTAIDKQSRTALSYCLAELCLTLSMLASEQIVENTMRMIFIRIGPECHSGDSFSLNLLSNIASRAPIALWRFALMDGEKDGESALANLLTSALTSIQNRHEACESYEESMEYFMKALFQVAIASNIAEDASEKGNSSAVAEVSNALFSQIQPTGSRLTGPIKTNSFSAKLGHSILPSLFSLILSPPIHDNVCRLCTQHLVECATRALPLLAGSKSSLRALIEACLHIAQMSPSQDSMIKVETKLSALEVLVSIVECMEVKKILLNNENRPLLHMMLSGYEDQINKKKSLPVLCIEIMVDGVDDDLEAWSKEAPSLQEGSYWEEDDHAIYAEDLLERFLHALGGTQTLSVLFPMLETLIQSTNWKYQRAALAILEKCLSAFSTSFKVHIPVAINTTLSLSKAENTNERLQWQCMQFIGTLCTMENVDLVQKPFGGNILESIAHIVTSKTSCGKVVSHACLALVSFCRGGNEESFATDMAPILRPYLKDVLMALASGPLAQNYMDPMALCVSSTVVINALGAVACLADVVGTEFSPFYHDFMPGLISCASIALELKQGTIKKINSSNFDSEAEEQLGELRGAAVESASIIIQAIADEDETLFVHDAEKIIELALPILSATDMQNGIIPFDQLLAACARIASVMKERFIPFLPAVVPHLLKRASQEANVSIAEADEAGLKSSHDGEFEVDSEEGTESVTLSIPGMGMKKLTISTSQMQEKAQAARAIYELASSLGSFFWIHAEACAKVFLPLVHFKYSSEVRSTSAQALVPIFSSMCDHASLNQIHKISILPLIQNLLPLICTAIVKELQNEEDDMEVIFAYAEALCEVLYCSYDTKCETEGNLLVKLSKKEGHEIVNQIITTFLSCLRRRSNLIQEMRDAEKVNPEGNNTFENILVKETSVLSKLVDSIGYTLKSLGPDFNDIFDSSVAPALQRFLTSAGTDDMQARFGAVCLFDDCVEHCGEIAAAKYAPVLLQSIIETLDNLKHESSIELQQASIYGIAQIARHAPSTVLLPVAIPMSHMLENIIREYMGRRNEIDYNALLENSVSAMATLNLFNRSPFKDMTGINTSVQLELFMQALPLQLDYGEAKICHDGFCDMIDSGVIEITDLSKVPKILRIFSECALLLCEGEDIVTSNTCARFTLILKRIREQIGISAMERFLSNLPLNSKLALQNVCTLG